MCHTDPEGFEFAFWQARTDSPFITEGPQPNLYSRDEWPRVLSILPWEDTLTGAEVQIDVFPP